RYVLTPTKICAAHALDTPFHIRSSADKPGFASSRSRPNFFRQLAPRNAARAQKADVGYRPRS
ncbi:MAG TPA: hypothetical protein VGL99_12060, partial [Chloroflexota bacterium]